MQTLEFIAWQTPLNSTRRQSISYVTAGRFQSNIFVNRICLYKRTNLLVNQCEFTVQIRWPVAAIRRLQTLILREQSMTFLERVGDTENGNLETSSQRDEFPLLLKFKNLFRNVKHICFLHLRTVLLALRNIVHTCNFKINVLQLVYNPHILLV